MIKALFVDTAGWQALQEKGTQESEAARFRRDQWIESGGILVTTDYVIDESLTLIRVRLGLRNAERWWMQVEGSSIMRIEAIDALRADKARAIFFSYRDKEFSFTDCTSFVIMRELKLTTALTLDEHFRHMGFETIP